MVSESVSRQTNNNGSSPCITRAANIYRLNHDILLSSVSAQDILHATADTQLMHHRSNLRGSRRGKIIIGAHAITPGLTSLDVGQQQEQKREGDGAAALGEHVCRPRRTLPPARPAAATLMRLRLRHIYNAVAATTKVPRGQPRAKHGTLSHQNTLLSATGKGLSRRPHAAPPVSKNH
ncbi:hypothetical protein QAD02_007072 [Eretmocerus hayati]|uniref:Uncharacterized protein n=1 Tax=Eretmocerus hayati TaxID=131215 RepID=A0ACC2N2K8_9HYME|nr:hypothetical protein QAD02_007072 [Eretmocerus hayati]